MEKNKFLFISQNWRLAIPEQQYLIRMTDLDKIGEHLSTLFLGASKEKPENLFTGCELYEIEDDGTLKFLEARYDTSD